jgi:hypothetical protein
MSLCPLYCACAVLAVSSAEADVGIGVSAKTDEATAYIPITAGRFLFEPYFRSSDRTEDNGTETQHTETYAIGVGIFRLVEPAERVTLYYGGRLARLKEEARSERNSDGAVFGKTESDGNSIVPTIGFEYHMLERLSIGAELGVDRRKVETITTSFYIGFPGSPGFPFPPARETVTTRDTKAELIVRFFF